MDELISNHEKNYIIDGMQQGIRNDGRNLADYRPIALDTGILSGSNGSARVQIGRTDVIVAVKAEMNSVERGEPIENRLRFFVDISANAGTKFAGKGGNELAEEMAKALYIAYDNEQALPDLRKLVLAPTHFWLLFVDVLVVQFDGNPMDAISLAVKAALWNTEICNVVVRPADEGKVLIDLPDEASTWNMDTTSAPLVVAVNRIGDKNVFDADLMEEFCSTSILYVGVQPTINASEQSPAAGRGEEEEWMITCLKKRRGGSLELDSLDEMTGQAAIIAKVLDSALLRKLRTMEAEGRDDIAKGRTAFALFASN